MAKLTAAQRASMPQSDYALPGKRFPMPDASHARAAISGATRAENAGNISGGQAAGVKAKARAKINDTPMTGGGSIKGHKTRGRPYA